MHRREHGKLIEHPGVGDVASMQDHIGLRCQLDDMRGETAISMPTTDVRIGEEQRTRHDDQNVTRPIPRRSHRVG